MKVIDLFAGSGGLSLGFMKDGHNIISAVEYDENIALSYKENHPDTNVIVDDIKNVDNLKFFEEGSADIIIGGPPCQGFSMAGSRIRNDFIDDPRNYLFKHYFNIVKLVKPSFFIMENVKGLMTMQGGDIFNEILKIFSDSEMLDGKAYNVNYKLVKGTDFGIPQKRERLIIIGTLQNDYDFDEIWSKTKDDISAEIPTYFNKVTIYDAISNLPGTTKDGFIDNPKPETDYQMQLASNSDIISNHTKTNHSNKAIERMKQVSPGENYTSINETINSVHSGSYGRLEWDKPGLTITTRFDTPSGGRFIHPVENRTLSPREAARIQSFPDDYVFYGNKTSIATQIGNAVPPKISYFLSRLISNISDSEG